MVEADLVLDIGFLQLEGGGRAGDLRKLVLKPRDLAVEFRQHGLLRRLLGATEVEAVGQGILVGELELGDLVALLGEQRTEAGDLLLEEIQGLGGGRGAQGGVLFEDLIRQR